MKNIYDDNKIISPKDMEIIAKEYAKQKQNNILPTTILTKLQDNLSLLEYLHKFKKGTSANLQKCLIKTYSVLKLNDLSFSKLDNCSNTTLTKNNNLKNNITNSSQNPNTTSSTQAKQTLLKNSVEIIQDITQLYKNILTEMELKAFNVSLENIILLI